MSDQTARYSKTMIVVHWLTALLVIVAYLTSEGGRHVRTDPPMLHFAAGVAVLVLLLPRLIARLLGGAPPVEDTGEKWLALAAKGGHAALYLLLIAVPLSGWYALSQMAVEAKMFGFTLPSIAAVVEGKSPVGDIHSLGGNLILILAGLHAAAALWHHFLRKDDTLRRMSPF